MPVDLVQRGPFSYDEYTNISSSDASTRTFTLTKAKFDPSIGEVLEVFVDGVKLVGDGTFVTGGSNPGTGASAHEFSVNSAKTQLTIVSDSDLASATDSAVTTVSAGNDILIRRVSERSTKKVDFAPGSVIREADLDNANTQVFHVAQEAIDTALQGMVLDAGSWNAESGGVNRTIKNAATPASSDPSHYVATKGYVDGQNTTATVASIEQQVTTVAGISTDVTTVADAVKETVAYTLTASGGKFYIAGGEFSSATSNPVLNLQRGSTYTFDYSDSSISSGSHVLGFSSTDTNTNNSGAVAYTGSANGITDNTVDKIITFVVPASAPDTLYYYCTAHNAMGNTMNIAEDSIEVVADNIANVNKVAAIDGNVTKVANIDSDVTKVVALGTDGGDVTTVANIGTNGADVTTVAGKATEINTLVNGTDGTSGTGGSTNNLTLIDNVENALPNINTVATNISNVNSFANTYFGAHASDTAVATHISTNSLTLGAGDLYYRTSGDTGLKSYNGSAWESMETSVGGNTVTSTTGNNLNLVTPSNSNKVVINSGSASIQLPNVRAAQDNYVLAMSNTSTGETTWQVTQTAPTITGITSGQLNTAETLATRTGTTTSGSTTISAISTTNLVGGEYVYGNGIPANTTISSISQASTSNNNDGSIVISNSANASASGVTLSITSPGEPKGGTLVIAGTDFGTNISDITAVRICASDGSSQVNATTLGSLSDTSITATWNGTESGYSTFSGVYHVEIVKSGLTSNRFNSTKSFSGDPTISSVTGTGGEGDGITVTSSNLGSYGGAVAGGGQDSNTKLLLNFDRTGGTDIEDSSNTGGDGHKITASGNAVIKASPFGDGKSAIFFNGSNDQISIANHADFQINSSGGSGTIEMWIYPTTIQNYDVLFIRYGISGRYDHYCTLNADGAIIWWRYDSSNSLIGTITCPNGTIVTNKWQHCAFTMSGTTQKIYVDGVEKGSVTLSGSTNHATDVPLIFGKHASNAFNGYMDEIRFIKGTDGTNGAIYTGDFDVPTSRLTAITNTKLLIHSEKDLETSDSNHQITHEGNVTYNTTSPKWTNRSAMYFDGSSGSGIRIPQSDDFDFGTGAFTIRGWVKPSSASGNEVIFSTTEWNGNNNADGTALMLRKSGSKWYINATKTDYSGWEFETASSSNVTTSWQHFVVTKASGTAPVKLIIDGTTEVTTSNITSIASTSGFNYKDFFIGGFIGGQRFTGYISDFEVLKGESTTTSPINSETTKSTNTKLLLLGTTAGLFADSATSGTTHTITPTGSYHSQDHGGIAPALAFPASLKKTGSAGVYFDGTGDYLSITTMEAPGTSDYTYDFWMYPITLTGTLSYIFDTRNSSNANGLALEYYENGTFKLWDSPASAYIIETTEKVTKNQWNHIAIERHSGTVRLYINGVASSDTHTSNTSNLSGTTMKIGQYQLHTTHSQYAYSGYLDTFRFVKDGVYEGSNFNTALPTQIYGAMYPANPSVGTITITGATTDSTDVAFSETSSLLSGLGLTLTDGGTSGATDPNGASVSAMTAHITGTLTGVVSSDTTTNNIRIQAKANADNTRITEVNESSGVGAVSITKRTGGEPVLFNARRYAGNSTNRNINGLGFQPDLVWIKGRDISHSHQLFDSVRGVGKTLHSDTTASEVSTNQFGYIDGFSGDGFSLKGGSNANSHYATNHGVHPFISWAWKAGGAPTATNDNTSGAMDANSVSVNGTLQSSYTPSGSPSIYPNKMSVNTNGGFSIVTYDGVRSSAGSDTIPHGLGSAPDLIIIKQFSSGDTFDWSVGHSSTNLQASSGFLKLNSNGALDSSWDDFGASPDANVFTTQYSGRVNASGREYVAYCWKAVSGVSAFGTYTGGTSISETTNFEPKLIIIKNITNSEHWIMLDAFRGFKSSSLANPPALFPSAPDGEVLGSSGNYYHITTNSTGFTIGDSSNVVNGLNDGSSSTKYIYMAFA